MYSFIFWNYLYISKNAIVICDLLAKEYKTISIDIDG